MKRFKAKNRLPTPLAAPPPQPVMRPQSYDLAHCSRVQSQTTKPRDYSLRFKRHTTNHHTTGVKEAKNPKIHKPNHPRTGVFRSANAQKNFH